MTSAGRTPWMLQWRHAWQAGLSPASTSPPWEDWLLSAARRTPGWPRPDPAPSPQEALLRSLAPAETLLADLRALCHPHPPIPLLQLALLMDCLDCLGSEPPQVAAVVQRALIEATSAPAEQAGCLLAQGEQRRPALLARPSAVELLRSTASLLLARTGASDHPFAVALEKRLLALRLAGLRYARVAPASLEEATQAAQRRAPVQALLADGCSAGWEIQRSGLLDRPLLHGDLFFPLIMVEAAARAGLHAAPALASIGLRRREIGLRYYRELPQMPLDADDASALLVATAACDVRDQHGLQAQARRVLAAALQADGSVHTWVELAGQPAPPPPDPWHGMGCAGVVARSLRALSLPALDTGPDLLRRCAGWLAAQAAPDGSYTGSYYPSRALTTALVLEGLAAAKARDALDDEGSTALQRAATWLSGQQLPTGVIGGGALDTASALLALDAAGSLPAALACAAAAFLVSSQQGDGLWPADDFVIAPRGDGQLGAAGSAPVTTLMALAGLAAAHRALRAGPPALDPA